MTEQERDPEPDPDLKVFARNMLWLRSIRYGLTQAEMADRCGLSMSTINRLELARTEPGILKVMKVATACNVTIDWLIGRAEGVEDVFLVDGVQLEQCRVGIDPRAPCWQDLPFLSLGPGTHVATATEVRDIREELVSRLEKIQGTKRR